MLLCLHALRLFVTSVSIAYAPLRKDKTVPERIETGMWLQTQGRVERQRPFYLPSCFVDILNVN